MRVGEGDTDAVGHPRAEPVREARARVLLVHDHRDAPATGREVGGRRDVAAEADDDLGAGGDDGLLGGGDGATQVRGQPQEVAGRAPRERHLRHLEQAVAPLGDEAGLEPGGGAQRRDLDVGVAPAQAVGEGQQR